MNEIVKRVPRSLPVLYSEGTVLYPFSMTPINIYDDSQKKALEYALENEKILAVFLAKGYSDDFDVDLYEYGAAVSIIRTVRDPDDSITIWLQGISRIKREKITQHSPFIIADIKEIPENTQDTPLLRATRKITLELVDRIISENLEYSRDIMYGLKNIDQHSRTIDIISANLPFPEIAKQKILETYNLADRYSLLNKCLTDLIKKIKIENNIRSKVQIEIDEEERRNYLRELLNATKQELGETDGSENETQKWQKKIDDANLPEHVLTAANDELNRLMYLSPYSSEYSVIKNYLDWLVNLPWRTYTEDCLDIPHIESVLENDHFGLEKAKERIVEYLAVKKLKKKLKGPILCFVGPPGVGKTSMGQSIAKAMNRQFIRVSLGGINDEAEIRGHRRTYIGSMPGKVITEIKRCKAGNPVFMLDEIDKVERSHRGDPASALLELLDPEQNFSFMDNYLNLAFDLSEVFFICTANSLETIPAPLRDRMEVIEFQSYIEEEKVQIAKDYLIPKEMENNGLNKKHIQINESAIKEIIRYYVREAGVRTLQRNIASLMRKVAKKVASGDESKNVITDKNIKDYLGKRKYSIEISNRKPEIGIVTGLAWTAYGGELLFCESSILPGKGKMILTGLLGEVMQESAKIAMSFIKSNHEKHMIDLDVFEKNDIHVHFPAGAIPKEGPSAGVALTTSIVSLLTNKKARHDIAMTGEITLYGKILPIGGVREKVLAAKRAGIKKVLLPHENQDSYEEIVADVKKGMHVTFVKHIDEVLNTVLM